MAAPSTAMAIDESALLACHARLEKALHNVLYRWLWDAHECQDVIQDTFLAVWSRRRRIDAATLDPLVWTTALNLAKNRLRWRRLRRFVTLDDEPAEQPGLADAFAVRQALERLDAGHRDVVLLSEIAGLTTSEIAAVLGIPAGTVGSPQASRARAVARVARRPK